MKKEFNITGTCIPEKHYMVDITTKINEIFSLVEEGKYFTINRPRQFGKTTNLFLLFRRLRKEEEYFPIKISFEDLGNENDQEAKNFIRDFLHLLESFFLDNQETDLAQFLEKTPEITRFSVFGNFLSKLISKIGKKVVLIIDEVDQSSNQPYFLQFLGVLRTKYLLQEEGQGATFHSVILTGICDIKTLTSKIPSEEKNSYSSLWNISTNFTVDLGFQPSEISTMLSDYSQDKKIKMDIPAMAKRIYFYTFGYPFFVSRLCMIMDKQKKSEWTEEMLEWAVRDCLQEKNTNFQHLTKNIEYNEDLALFICDLILTGEETLYNINNPLIEFGEMYGIFRNEKRRVKIHNRIYELLLYDYFTSKIQFSIQTGSYNAKENLIQKDGNLDFEQVLSKFQEFMQQQHSKHDLTFIERNGRLIFLAFLKPIINGKGFDFKEVEVSEEKRLDIVVTFLNQKYVVELKIWHGEKAHQKGIVQLSGYLDALHLNQGYLIIFDFRKKKKTWKQEQIQHKQKTIFIVWV